MKKYIFRIITVLSISFFGISIVGASELVIPNQFSDGQVTSASEMNENFAAIAAAVNDNNSRLSGGVGSSSSSQGFLAFSSAKINGGSGLYEMQKICNDFSAGSRVCTINEIVFSSYNASVSETLGEPDQYGNYPKRAWFLEELNGSYLNSCYGWSDARDYFTAKSIAGNLTVGNSKCNIENSVACCK